MKELVKSFEDLPQIAKIILAIPCLDIIWAIVRTPSLWLRAYCGYSPAALSAGSRI